MRIISGLHKGRRINAPKKLPVRPTTDMAKEALFNIISNKYNFELIKVLDLFSGTGNISYEFCSRGTKNIQSVDIDRRCIKFIKETSNKLDMQIHTVCNDVYKHLEKSIKQFDIIFADPPYDINQDKLEKVIDLIFKNKLINENGVCIIEHSKHRSLDNQKNFTDRKIYGGNCFSFFYKKKQICKPNSVLK